jgi:4-hydroxyphenylpyruvate dioxygenase
MEIDSIHFYVRDAARMRDWALSKLGLDELAILAAIDRNTLTYAVGNDRLCLKISSPLNPASVVANYLQKHPPGVKDIAFRVRSLDAMKQKLDRLKIAILETSSVRDDIQWLKISGWGAIEHTIVEDVRSVYPEPRPGGRSELDPIPLAEIDHVVLNVAAGDLAPAVDWYRDVFDLDVWQTFDIRTQTSGLSSKALVSACGRVRFNINEPSSVNSQIQAFIDANGGAGIQHIALHTQDICRTVDRMQQQGLPFLSIPKSYYTSLKMRAQTGLAGHLTRTETQAVERLGILVDWQQEAPDALLMQIFTQPIFAEPTFFFEIIERRNRALGFGQGNFQALFEAVERADLKTA